MPECFLGGFFWHLDAVYESHFIDTMDVSQYQRVCFKDVPSSNPAKGSLRSLGSFALHQGPSSILPALGGPYFGPQQRGRWGQDGANRHLQAEWRR